MKNKISKSSVFKSAALAALLTSSLLMFQNMNAQGEKGNILLKQWHGDYGGVPAFDKMDLKDLKPALVKAMKMHSEEVEKVANGKEEPTFQNTILELEKSGKELNRVFEYYGIWSANKSSKEFREISKEMAPAISAHRSKMIQNQKLFKRVKSVYESSLKKPLEADQQRLVEIIYKRFEMNGAELDETKKKQYAEIEKELSELYLKFSNNVLHDEENYVTFLTKDQLGGLSEGFIKSAQKIATDKGKPEMYAITNTRSSMDPFLRYSTERALREKVWRNYYSRGDNGDEYDNNELIAEILRLRRERVALLGYKNFAEWRLQNRMAKTPENALKLMEQVWEPAIQTVAEEVKEMQALAIKNGDDITIEPWDYRFYAEKVRKAKYDLDSDEVKQYLQLNKLTEAMHDVALKLFDFKLTPLEKGNIPVFHEDVKVWEVTNNENGEHIGLWYLDPYARKGKRSGAWATTYRSHQTLYGKGNVLGSNNSNFVKPAPGEPLLVSWDDAITFFHEFGHALYFFSSKVKYPTLNGGVRDYTEFQSQLLERWLSTD